MSDKDRKAQLQAIETALDKLEAEYNKGMIDLGRYLQLKTEYETRKAKLKQEPDNLPRAQRMLGDTLPERSQENTVPASDRAALRQYQDFELTVVAAPKPNTYLVTARSASGRASSQMTLDPTGDELRAALNAIERQDTDEDFFYKLGAQLFNALLPGDVEDAYRTSLGYAKGEGKRLRLRLCLTEVPEIAALPWEYLYDRQRDIFLGVSNDTPLSRFIEPQQTFPPPPPPQGKLRILTVISDPEDLDDYGLPPLDAEKELKTLNRAFKRLKAQNLLEEIEPLRHAIRSDISEALREHRPHVLHFIGHGTFEGKRGKLIIEDEDHYAVEMSGRAFRELLEGYPDTRLVVLNACKGATRAVSDAMVGLGPQLVSRGVPAVVAMQHAVYDRAAINFTREFYRALAHWYPIDMAISEARRAIYLDFGLKRRDWGSPVLFMRDKEGILFQRPADTETSPPIVPKRAVAPPTKAPEPADPNLLQQIFTIYIAPSNKLYPACHERLRQILTDYFSDDDLRDLCASLDLEYSILRGQGKLAKIRELIPYFERHGRARELLEAILHARPHVSWFEPGDVSPIKLHQAMCGAYDPSSLDRLGQRLGVAHGGVYGELYLHYDKLRGETLPDKIQDLIDWHRLKRRFFPTLIRLVLQDHPHLADQITFDGSPYRLT
jgi:hypothetical protein